jgi:hypothetical protein
MFILIGILKSPGCVRKKPMTSQDKIRLGMIALIGLSVLFVTLGVHVSPLDTLGGYGGWCMMR